MQRMGKVKRVLAILLAALMVVGLFGLKTGAKAEASDYLYKLSAPQVGPSGVITYDYQDGIYDNEKTVLFQVIVRPAIDKDKYDVGFEPIVGNMMWGSLEPMPLDENNPDDATLLGFRGNTFSFGNPDSGVMTVNIVDKSTKEVVGTISVNMEFFNSGETSKVTFDGNGGYVNADKEESMDIEVNNGSTIGKIEGLQPEYKDDSKTFVGWKDSKDNLYYMIDVGNPQQKSVYDIEPKGDMTIKAYWVDNCEITFATDSGKITSYSSTVSKLNKVEDKEVSFFCPSGEKCFCNVSVTAQGKILVGWKIGDTNEMIMSGREYEFIPTQDTTLNAVFEDAYSLTFVSDEGYLRGEADLKELTISIPKDTRIGLHPTYRSPVLSGREGYVLAYWVDQATGAKYTDSQLNSLHGETPVIPTSDMTFKSEWKPEHTWAVKEVIKEATCTEAGSQLMYCTDDGCTKTKIEEIPPKGHTVVIDQGVAPTKTKTGLTTGSHCSVCGAILKPQTVVPKITDDGSGSSSDSKPWTAPVYSNEWVDGKWYNADGTQTYKGTLSWMQNATGWWVEDSEGWFPTSQWQKIDGKWYYFCADGYMDYSEYRDGCWLGADGAWVESYSGGHWMTNGTGWWYEDNSGWYPADQYLWIDGTKYWFGSDGYWAYAA